VTDLPQAGGEPSRAAGGKMDGRRLRSERTRQLIIDAYMALVRESANMPTAAQIAERAGYSVRSVFERFPDLLSLRLAVTDYAIAEGRRQGGLRDLDADRVTRIRSHVESRANGCDRWLPFWRVLTANPAESEELQRRIRLVRELVRLRLELMFKPELSGVPEEQRRRLLVALEAITDYESWGRMREFYRLGFEEACAVWVDAMDRLLPPTPAVS
jgi:AcrR family transcriptional regulator